MFHGGTDYNLMYRNKFFFCFSQCNKSYTVINLVSKVLNISYGQAIGWLKKLLNLSDDTEIEPISCEARQTIDVLHTLSKKGKKSVSYLPLPEIVTDSVQYGITHSIFTKEGFDKETFSYYKLGICSTGFFENRIFIPIFDPSGKIMFTASGRSLSKEMKPKYLLWEKGDKSTTLYNYHNCKKANKKTVFVVEGFKSVWRMHQWGYENVVAVMGSHLPDYQVKLLIALDAKIVVIGDNDEGGRVFNQAVVNKLHYFCEVQKIDISATGCDPSDSVAELSQKEFEELIGGTK